MTFRGHVHVHVPIHVHVCAHFCSVHRSKTIAPFYVCDSLRSIKMDAALKNTLQGITEDTLSVLLDEAVISLSIFHSLREEHFEKLLPQMKVGQHVLLLKIWDRHSNFRNISEVSQLI